MSAAVAAALYALWTVRGVLVLGFLAVFLALALGPAVDYFQRRRLPRILSILLVYLCIVLAIFGIGLLIVPPVVNGVDQLSKDIPGYVDHLRKSRSFRKYDDKYDITGRSTSRRRSSRAGWRPPPARCSPSPSACSARW